MRFGPIDPFVSSPSLKAYRLLGFVKNNFAFSLVSGFGEIMTRTEDTTIEACFARVQRMFPATRVVKFSAFARILKSGSEALRAIVSAHTDGTNDAFDLKWATENLVEKRLAQMSRVLRATRDRAVSAEHRAVSAQKDLSIVKTRLDEADARVDKMLGALKRVESHVPVYDKPAELVIKREASGLRVFSLPMMMLGGTVEVVASIGGVRLPKGPLRSPACASKSGRAIALRRHVSVRFGLNTATCSSPL
jgi:hypothetical protein